MDFLKIYSAAEEAANRLNAQVDGDYIKNGLLHCGKCHTAKQCHTQRPVRDNLTGDIVFVPTVAGCVCKCKKEELEREEIELKIYRLKADCFDEPEMKEFTFANDDMLTPKVSKAMQNYVDNFEQFYKTGKGLLLHATATGTGKTYYAACIANALMEKRHPVIMTSFPKILNDMMNDYKNRNNYLYDLNSCDLLILDDWGVERTTETAREIVYSVVDARYRSGRPFIVTTNTDIEKIKKPADVNDKRICDRILARCHPIEINQVSRRREQIKKEFGDMQDLLFGE